MFRRCTVLFLAAFICATSSYAKPALWYLWESKTDGKRICKQTSPGPEWKKLSGPYPDSRCTRLIIR